MTRTRTTTRAGTTNPTKTDIAVSDPPGPLRDKAQHLYNILAGFESVIVAFSGGTDSAFLAHAATTVLGSRALAVTADGAVHYIDDPAAGGRATVQTERLPLAPSGASPVMAWATTGDWETRLVLAYPAPVGFELWVLGVGLGNELTPMDTTLMATDLDRVRVTSHEGVVVVAGPVADDVRKATGCRVWMCPDPDFGEQDDWEELSLDPAPDTVTDAQDASVWWWLGGSREGAADRVK